MGKLIPKLAATAIIGLAITSGRAEISDHAGLDAYLQRAVETTKIPGIVAAAVNRDEIIYSAAVGQRNLALGEAMTMDTVFRIASMTKPVAATAIMLLVEEGKLDLDDAIAEFMPAFAGRAVIVDFNPADASYSTRPPAGDVTIRHLLSHSSGLAYGFASDIVAQLSNGNAGPNAEAPLLYDPGTAWSYAGGIAIVGEVLERIEGVGLDSFLRDRLFKPLSMHDTSFIVPLADHDRVATTHRLDDDGQLVEIPNPVDIRSAVSGDGGLHSTAADYVKFIQLFLNDGIAPNGERLLSSASIREMSRNQLGGAEVSLQDEPLPNLARAFPLGADRDGFGLGFQVTGDHENTSTRRPGSLSWAGIYNTEFWIDPAAGLGAVLLMQYLPFYDEDAIETLIGFEARLYERLGTERPSRR